MIRRWREKLRDSDFCPVKVRYLGTNEERYYYKGHDGNTPESEKPKATLVLRKRWILYPRNQSIQRLPVVIKGPNPGSNADTDSYLLRKQEIREC